MILYVSEVEDTHHRLAFLDGGAILNLPLFYLEGICDVKQMFMLLSCILLVFKLVFGWRKINVVII